MKQYRLYGFCDASIAAYAAVIYLVEENSDDNHSSFIVSKTRVAPLQTQTIPRLELLSALLLARLMVNVISALNTHLNLEEARCFTDSQVTLYWIKGLEKEWKPFVQHRVNEIRKLIPAECWDHCAGKSNPADIPSRGLTPLELVASKLWRKGPDWLQISFTMSNLPDEIPELCTEEMKASCQRKELSLLVFSQNKGISSIIDCKCYSTVQKLYRVTAYVLKFLSSLKKEAHSPELMPQDRTVAERLWLMDCQLLLVSDCNFPAWRIQFDLFKADDELWRCGGRLQNTELPYSSKHPILLSKKHYLTSLLVMNAHQRVQHNGVKETLTEVRSKYWIIRGRSLVKAIIHKCVICKRFDGKPLKGPPAPPLPAFRVNEAPPFTSAAVDFAGPVYIRNQGVSTSNKVWICLFTCCVTRAVHLELVLDLSAVTFVRCLKRFTARRGLPQRILSDNAKTFKATAKAIATMLKEEDVKNYLSHVGIKWTFNLEKAAWWVERLIKSTKRCLRKMIGQAKFLYDEMHTAIVEIEAIINSRPLSYVSSDDIEEPLTPSHLLVGRRILSLPDNLNYLELDDFEVSDVSVQRRAKHLNSVLNHFWRRWSKEYLLELRESHRHHHLGKSCSSISIGDIVIVHDQDHPRGFWKVAKVERMLLGKDGHVRGAVLTVASRSGHPMTLQRPLQLLYPLELNHHGGNEVVSKLNEQHSQTEDRSEDSDQDEPSVHLENDTQNPSAPTERRCFALRAQDKFKEWAESILEESDDDR